MKKFRSFLKYEPPIIPVVGCRVSYASNYNPEATVSDNESCIFPDNSNRILIVENSQDNINSHGIYVRDAINAGYGSDISNRIDIIGSGLTEGFQIANDTNYKFLVYSYTNAGEYPLLFLTLYPEVQGFMPLGSNSFIELITPTQIPVMILAGSGSTENITGYGMGLEFWDEEYIGSPAIESSLTNGVVAGKILKIMEERECGFWEARYCARITADRNESRRPEDTIWTKFDGFGKINTTAAIAYNNSIPADPFLNNGNVYTPFIP